MAGMIAEIWSDELTARISALLPQHAIEFQRFVGQPFLVIPPGAIIAVLSALKHELQFDFLVDVTAVDYPQRVERFDLIYIVYSFSRNLRIRVKTSIGKTGHPASATVVYQTANWLEREVYDMFGIEFSGHPNLKRILLPEGWDGFPLRKDYSILQQDQAWVQRHLGIESGQ